MTTGVSQRLSTLVDELRQFPRLLTELLMLKDDAYYLMLSSKPYDVEWTNRGKHPPARSQVERIVVNFLTSSYISHLEDFTHACENLLSDCTEDDRTVLFAFWRGEGSSILPEHLVYRYGYYRDCVGLPDDFCVQPRERE